eukprot:4234021-Amphidinium_carterae.1
MTQQDSSAVVSSFSRLKLGGSQSSFLILISKLSSLESQTPQEGRAEDGLQCCPRSRLGLHIDGNVRTESKAPECPQSKLFPSWS